MTALLAGMVVMAVMGTATAPVHHLEESVPVKKNLLLSAVQTKHMEPVVVALRKDIPPGRVLAGMRTPHFVAPSPCPSFQKRLLIPVFLLCCPAVAMAHHNLGREPRYLASRYCKNYRASLSLHLICLPFVPFDTEWLPFTGLLSLTATLTSYPVTVAPTSSPGQILPRTIGQNGYRHPI